MSYQHSADFLSEEAEYYQASIVSDWPSCASLGDRDEQGDMNEPEFLELQEAESGASSSSALEDYDEMLVFSSAPASPSNHILPQQPQELTRTRPDRDVKNRHNVTFQLAQSRSPIRRDETNDFFGPKFGIRRKPTPHPSKMRASLAHRTDYVHGIPSRLDSDPVSCVDRDGTNDCQGFGSHRDGKLEGSCV